MVRFRRSPLLLFLGALLLLGGIVVGSVLWSVQRTGCEGTAQMMAPLSPLGVPLSNTGQPGACFVSQVEIGTEMTRLLCRPQLTFASCQDWYQDLSSNWTNLFYTRCTALAFMGGAACDCVETGAGCQQSSVEVEIRP